jgi:NDP-sugar pyrophosphorylase family protein
LKIGPRPLLESILLSFIEYGFKKYYISVHYLSEQVKSYFGDGSKWGVKISYVEEASPLGTAGGLSLLPDSISVPVIVMNGDLLTKVDFSALLDFHLANESVATMCVREYSFQIPYGVIESDGIKITKITEKPSSNYFVNAGIYVISPDIIKNMQKNVPVDMPNIFTDLIDSKNVVSMFPLHEYWLDIGRLGDFEKAQNDILEFFP